MKDSLTIRAGGICGFCGKVDESIHIHPCERCGIYTCRDHILAKEHRCKPRCIHCKRFMSKEDVLEGFWTCVKCDPGRDEDHEYYDE